MAEKAKCVTLTAKEKREICLFSKNWPNKSQQDIANHFSAYLKKDLKRRTIGDILSTKKKGYQMKQI